MFGAGGGGTVIRCGEVSDGSLSELSGKIWVVLSGAAEMNGNEFENVLVG